MNNIYDFLEEIDGYVMTYSFERRADFKKASSLYGISIDGIFTYEDDGDEVYKFSKNDLENPNKEIWWVIRFTITKQEHQYQHRHHIMYNGTKYVFVQSGSYRDTWYLYDTKHNHQSTFDLDLTTTHKALFDKLIQYSLNKS